MNGARDIAIAGIGVTVQSRGSGRSAISLLMESIGLALDDAGLSMRDVDGYVGFTFPAGNGQGMNDANVARQFGQPMTLVAETSGAQAVLLAGAAIRAGLAEVVVIPAGGSQSAGAEMATYTRPTYEFTEWTGSMTPAQFALIARRHMHEFGTTSEQLAAVAATAHRHGRLNPEAVAFGRPALDADAILNARMIADPFTQPMCSLVNDGASCIVVTSAERARDCRHAPVWVLGGAFETRSNSYFEAPSLGMMESRPRMIDGFARAGVVHDDVDIVMCYDHFVHGPIIQFETLGFCAPGEGGDYVPVAMQLDGAHPGSLDGGNLAYSHNGVPYNFKPIEIVRQFRGDTPDLCPGWREGIHTYDRNLCRKVRDPRLAIGCAPMTDGRHGFAILAKD
ncbi:thiolase family protein [Sphingomonas colocasiae]|uniref:Thiolase family protein n=1 Tax=Sphingomonas colocasiae TaxID=1848973 RepID=A0ABS7PI98_9SPHN|nr:thiolase family protein [Sphingomonas colocasiae]MBY8821018.1 thiolase family protein [Sphingomonas colocasiae]